jgi:hypothetical protein
MKKSISKQINHKIMILQHKCPSLNREKAKSAKIVETVNTKLGEEVTGKIIAARKLLSRNIILTTDLAETKNQLIKKAD